MEFSISNRQTLVLEMVNTDIYVDFTLMYERKNVYLRRDGIPNTEKQEKITQTQNLPQMLKHITDTEYKPNGIDHKNNASNSLSCQVSEIIKPLESEKDHMPLALLFSYSKKQI